MYEKKIASIQSLILRLMVQK